MLFVQPHAHGDCRIRIHGAIVLLDVLDFAVLIHDERGAPRKLVLVSFLLIILHNPVLFQHFPVHIAQEGKRHADLLGKCGIRSGRVNADSEYDGVACFQLGQISLIGLEFFRSTAGKRQYVKRENYILLSTVFA